MGILKKLFGKKQQMTNVQESASYWFKQGSVLGSQKRYTEALSCFEKALVLDPNHADAWESKAQTLYRLGRIEDSLPCYDRALALDQHHVHALFGKGSMLANLGRFSETIPFLEKALQLGHPLAEQALAQILEITG